MSADAPLELSAEVSAEVKAETASSSPPDLQALLAENRALKAQWAQAQTDLSHLTQALAHDLRGPVRHINAFVQVIEEDFGGPQPNNGAIQLPADLAGHLATIAQSAQQLALMVDALVRWSKLSAVEFKPERVALLPLVTTLSKAFDASPPPAWHIANDLPDVQADRTLLTQILQQLLANAVKFTAGGSAAQIEIGWRSKDTVHGELFVRDKGIGFDPRFQSQVFGLFQRLHAGERFAGLGMGLAIAHRLVQRHGGQIACTAALGHGCEMRFTLPLAPASSD